MTVLGWVWLSTPFILIAFVSRDRRLQRLVGSHLARSRVVGCAGVVMMYLGASVVPGVLGALSFTVGAPLTGLLAFLRRDDGDDGGDDEPDVPPVDWDEFERSFWAHVGGGRAPRGPRSGPVRDKRPVNARGRTPLGAASSGRSE